MNGSMLALDHVEISDRDEFSRAVLDGLAQKPRAIPAKFL